MMKNLLKPTSLLLVIFFFAVSCSKKLAPGEGLKLGFSATDTAPLTSDDDNGDDQTEKIPPPAPKPEGGYAKGQDCTGEAKAICQGGYDNDADPVDFKVKIVLASDPGDKLTNDPVGFSKNFVNGMNKYYVYKGHRYMNLVVDEGKITEDDDGLSDTQLITKYAEEGYLTMILVANIPGGTAGYVQNSCARVEQAQAWTVFEFGLVNAGVVEHESNHIFCFPHTSSQNGGTPRFFLPGYNTMEAVLRERRSFKTDKPIDPSFNIYVDGQNRSDAKETFDGMIYDTHNLMYYRVLNDRPALFTDTGDGFPYTYSHLLDYYYWKFVKPGAAK